MNDLTIVPRLLRDLQAFFESLRRGENIVASVRALTLSSILFLAVYGFVAGLSHSLVQALSSAIKMPLIFVATVFFCLPAFYFFSLLLGTRLGLLQVTAVILSGINVTAFLLLGLSPITLFFVLTSRNYEFFQLLAVAFVSISGWIGVYFFWRGMAYIDPSNEQPSSNLRHMLLGLWIFLYAFVASQMTWRLSPLIGNPDLPFVLIQPSRDNFYVDAFHAFEKILGVSALSANHLPWWLGIVVGLSCLLPLALLIAAVATGGWRKSQAALEA